MATASSFASPKNQNIRFADDSKHERCLVRSDTTSPVDCCYSSLPAIEEKHE